MSNVNVQVDGKPVSVVRGLLVFLGEVWNWLLPGVAGFFAVSDFVQYQNGDGWGYALLGIFWVSILLSQLSCMIRRGISGL